MDSLCELLKSTWLKNIIKIRGEMITHFLVPHYTEIVTITAFEYSSNLYSGLFYFININQY